MMKFGQKSSSWREIGEEDDEDGDDEDKDDENGDHGAEQMAVTIHNF